MFAINSRLTVLNQCGRCMNKNIVIIGAGLYGLYSALKIDELEGVNNREHKILVIELDSEAFGRATYINQARVHMGYHYPRSYSTAIKSAGYFDRFNEKYGFCINKDFAQVYATSTNFSWTNKNEFVKFCKNANIVCNVVAPETYFNDDCCDGAFVTKEYTYDAKILKDHLLDEIRKKPNIEILYNTEVDTIERIEHNNEKAYLIKTKDNKEIITDFIVNSTYAGVNTILNKLGFPMLDIKYELCEIILCRVNDKLKNVGITVMDGPFFSIMPFGKTGYHSLTSVTFTPHMTSYNHLPMFECQNRCEKGYCSKEKLGNCNNCVAKPKTAWHFMSSLAKKYMKEEYEFEYVESLFSVKPILMISEIDDSRPTVIKVVERKPTFISVLSGKINTVFDLDEVLKYELEQR